MKLAVAPPTPGSIADWSDVADLQARMIEAVQALEQMAADVGMSSHVREYDSDRRRRALARAMAAPLAGGSSAAAAEAEARASSGYTKEFEQLGKEHLAAEQVMADWNAKKLVWETCRSLLSLQKETVRHL